MGTERSFSAELRLALTFSCITGAWCVDFSMICIVSIYKEKRTIAVELIVLKMKMVNLKIIVVYCSFGTTLENWVQPMGLTRHIIYHMNSICSWRQWLESVKSCRPVAHIFPLRVYFPKIAFVNVEWNPNPVHSAEIWFLIANFN